MITQTVLVCGTKWSLPNHYLDRDLVAGFRFEKQKSWVARLTFLGLLSDPSLFAFHAGSSTNYFLLTDFWDRNLHPLFVISELEIVEHFWVPHGVLLLEIMS